MAHGTREHSTLRPSGVLITTAWDGGPEVHEDTIQCVHCHAHWIYRPGSGITRGYCTRCNGFVCGPRCVECVDKEQKLSNIEAGRPLLYRPTIVPVTRAIP